MSGIALRVYFTVCEGHRLEDGKSLKMLVTKGVFENTSLDNGRIEVHPMNPRETFAI